MKNKAILTCMLAMATAAIHAETLANGLEFHAPQGWTVKSNNDAGVLIPPDWTMEPNGKDPAELYLVALLPEVKDLLDPALSATLQRKFASGAQVEVNGAPQKFRAQEGLGYLYRYEAVSDGVRLCLDSYVVGLTSGGVAAVVAIGRPSLVARRAGLMAAVAAGLSRPSAGQQVIAPASHNTQWEQRLRGRKLYRFSGYSSSYGSGGMSSQTTLLLAANGNYEYHRASSVSVYVPGATGGSASKNAAQGQWRIYEQNGRAILELRPSTGGVENIVLSADGTKTLLNGQRWLVGD